MINKKLLIYWSAIYLLLFFAVFGAVGLIPAEKLASLKILFEEKLSLLSYSLWLT